MSRIRQIEARARAANLSLHELCVEARVPQSTLWRLRQPGADPRVRTIARVLTPLEELLSRKEARLRRALARGERSRRSA